jgi:predicted phosphohydrolase
MTTFQILSDLHIEYKNDEVPDPLDFVEPKSDILILAGDIGSLYKMEQLTEFLSRICTFFKIVLYVPGNHEYYSIPEINPVPFSVLSERLHNVSNFIPNLYILERTSILIGNLCVAGCTLWSEPDIIIPKYIVRITDFNTQIYKEKHRNDLVYINSMISYCQKHRYKLVMVTHYPPTFQVLSESKSKKKKFLSLYANKLDNLLYKHKVDTWICGHTHSNFNFFSENGTNILSNQLGKPKDHIQNFSKNFSLRFFQNK